MEEISEICRICLENDSQEMHKIFDECLNNKIVILTGLDLLQTDSLPKKICKNCRYQLEKSFHFRLLAKQSDTRLRKYARLVNQKKKAEHVLKRSYSDDDIEEFDEQLMESMKYFDEVKQQIEDEKQKAIEEELKKLQESTKQKTPKKLPTKPIQSPQTRASRSPQKPSDKPVVLLNKCPTSSPHRVVETVRRKFKKAEEIQKIEEIPIEIVEVDNGQYQIEIIEGECAEGREFQVVEIPTQFEIISDERLNLKPGKNEVKSDKRKFEVVQEAAQVVDVYCNVLSDQENPELDENGEKKIFKCAFEKCNETFSRRQQCKTHFYNHLATDSNFSCKYCEKKFKVASALERHERVHTNSKPFICETCNKGFSQKEMLKRHIMIHLPKNEAPFECNICNEKFRQKDPLRQHIKRVHTGSVSKYDCTICGKSFAHSSGLSRHLLIHSGKVFNCEICNRQFTDKSALKRHGSVHSKGPKAKKQKSMSEIEFQE